MIEYVSLYLLRIKLRAFTKKRNEHKNLDTHNEREFRFNPKPPLNGSFFSQSHQEEAEGQKKILLSLGVFLASSDQNAESFLRVDTSKSEDDHHSRI